MHHQRFFAMFGKGYARNNFPVGTVMDEICSRRIIPGYLEISGSKDFPTFDRVESDSTL